MAATPAPDRIAEAHAGMSLADYLARGDERFEIVHGREIPMSPAGYQHFSIIEALSDALKAYVRAQALGRVLVECTFIDPHSLSRNWVTGSIVPDIAFMAGTRVADYLAAPGIDETLPLALIPDLVIEVVSPTDRKADVLEKIAYMLQIGVKVIWSINPGRASVTVFVPDDDETILREQDPLTTDLLPGWSITVADLFNGKLEG